MEYAMQATSGHCVCANTTDHSTSAVVAKAVVCKQSTLLTGQLCWWAGSLQPTSGPPPVGGGEGRGGEGRGGGGGRGEGEGRGGEGEGRGRGDI